ncbi:hypothetical protein [Mangrovimonas spongiae]|uniref:Uncharacterized protein n=1 Tax=Mangrovimonas spongiae TaxID=2494697 RepID=A0A3R9PJ26_9FLAO|nr:hypothetical protein [Mangrovimonas spongiae]RSK39355.1 hypothetical protein EJA19_10555 [Mangrovimonas spongiae]
MKLKLLFLIYVISIPSLIFSQSVGFLGDFNDWGNDVNMNTTDNITFTLSNYYLPDTGLKFRQDDSWDNNWGGTTFPTGTWADNNIPVEAGFYDISIDIGSTEYIFTPVSPSDQNVGLIGDFNGWSSDLVLSTTDYITYTANNVALTAGEVKFRRDGNWNVNYGGTTLSGTAVPNSGDNIPIPSDDNYDISFNINTLEYSITETPTMSINNVSKQTKIFLTNNHLHINGYQGMATITVYDVFGRVIQQSSNTITNDFKKLISLPKNQLLLIKVEGTNLKKVIKVIAR